MTARAASVTFEERASAVVRASAADCSDSARLRSVMSVCDPAMRTGEPSAAHSITMPRSCTHTQLPSR